MVSTMKNHGCWDWIGEDEKVKTVTKNRNSQVDKMCSSRSRRSSFIVVDHAVFFHQLFYYKVPFNTTRGCYREEHDWTQSSLIHLSCASSYLIVQWFYLQSRTIEGELRNTYLPFLLMDIVNQSIVLCGLSYRFGSIF